MWRFVQVLLLQAATLLGEKIEDSKLFLHQKYFDDNRENAL